MKKLYYIFCLLVFGLQAQQDLVWLTPNKGQWEDVIDYKINIQNGEMYVDKTGFTFQFDNRNEVYGHKHHENHSETENQLFRRHAIKANFVGANENCEKIEENKSNYYYNYFIGNEQSKWKSNVYSYSKTTYSNFYDGINYIIEGKKDALNYSFQIQPGINPNLINLQIDGASKLEVSKNGDLLIYHTYGFIKNSKPLAWTFDANGKKKKVEIRFKLKDNRIQFEFPKSYTKSEVLFIDPDITFSSYTGSTADNWGSTAAPDFETNLFAAGIVFGAGYPTSAGIVDNSFNGGFDSGYAPFDIALSKFNQNGTSFLYSTYIGGSNGNESPMSIISDDIGNLYMLGVTCSNNFPMAGNIIDGSHNGGTPFVLPEASLGFQGTDLFLLKLSANGSQILGSTYFGGSANDGINTGSTEANDGNLAQNYGDNFRSEIVLDLNGNVLIASSTTSSNFPTLNASQASFGGNQDAVFAKFSGDLSNVLWSTYYGGSAMEAGYSVQVNSLNEVYGAGGTMSSNLTVPGGNSTSFNGDVDGFIVRLNSANSAIINATYVGTNAYDQTYFVQIDNEDFVYVYGQTRGAMSVTPGLYGVGTAGQFIRKYSSNLSNIEWTTKVGGPSNNIHTLSPTAFLVSQCKEIYFAGWGGSILGTSISNFPVTSDAFMSAVGNGDGFYISVLSPNATDLKYGTFIGGAADEHVDGGTSRFDKGGRIYHAVCSACGSIPNGFVSTPGVIGPTNNSNNCNLAAFKFELNSIEALATSPDFVICIPDPVEFFSNSINGEVFHWDFGDGNTSNLENPTHEYETEGVYTVKLIVNDSLFCKIPDSTSFEVEVGSFAPGFVTATETICKNQPYQLNAGGGTFYTWFPATNLNDATTFNPIATIDTTTDFSVIIGDACGSDTFDITLNVFPDEITVSEDASICLGTGTQIQVFGSVSQVWTPSTNINNSLANSPVVTPSSSVYYIVEATTQNNCVFLDSVFIDVFNTIPLPEIDDTVTMCNGFESELIASGGVEYFWYPPDFLNTTTSSIVITNTPNSTTYYCDFTNACGTVTDSVHVNVITPSLRAFGDTTICFGDSVNLFAEGLLSYFWQPTTTILDYDTSHIVVFPSSSMNYFVTGVDQHGCVDKDTVTVGVFARNLVELGSHILAEYNDQIQLEAIVQTGVEGEFEWSPPYSISCTTCFNPIVNPNENFQYRVEFTDRNGCKTRDVIEIIYDGLMYIPNTFTPDNNKFNPYFQVVGEGIRNFHLSIFNRWGELIYELEDLNDYWDGTYKGKMCQDGTYTWKLRYIDLKGSEVVKTGHVNLLR